MNILFLNLMAFSKTGGIEKFNRSFLKALSLLEEEQLITSRCISAYDDAADSRYYTPARYNGFKGKRSAFTISCIINARKADLVILGHVNLGIVGCLIHFLYPHKKIVLITHGIEVWSQLKGFKKLILKYSTHIITVSEFTKNKLSAVHEVDAKKITIFHDTIDPFFEYPSHFEVNQACREKYGLTAADDILFTLTRLAATEKYKGYDNIIECLPTLLNSLPALKYIIGGKYDGPEKKRIDELINKHGLREKVILAGFIPDDELVAHYQMSDVFIMTSKKEGFGIVFIEAMVCGLPVIAGSQDGSTDALQKGELGLLINPDDKREITSAVQTMFLKKAGRTEDSARILQQKTLEYFGFDKFKARLKQILLEKLA